MATDFAPFANLRLLIPQQAAAPTGLRDGLPASSASWVIEAFVKAEQAAARDGAETPSVDPSRRVLAGYITAWALLPENTDWLAASSAFSWDETGLAPSGLIAGVGGRGFLGVLPDLPTLSGNPQQGKGTIIGLSGIYGPGGIGAELRPELGDAITVELHLVA
jgi:hypothetical protein